MARMDELSSHCGCCGASLDRSRQLSESEKFDAAAIVRRYAQEIREDTMKNPPISTSVLAMLEDAAKQRDRLADKLDGGV